jgi:hypothetical protein
MALDSPRPHVRAIPVDTRALSEAVYRSYSALTSTLPLDAETGLGGKLLYAGEMAGGGETGGEGRKLLFAANIAGAASLAASPDPAVQRQAIRDGVVDFLVTSLEEALRILKNEIRKRQAVSVCVAIAPHVLVEQMLDRGVLPDLLPPTSWGDQWGDRGVDRGIASEQAEQLIGQGALPIVAGEDRKAGAYVTWSADRDFARWLPRLDSIVEESLPSDDWVRQRWLRLAPRYLGRIAQREHGVALSGDEVIRLRSLILELLAGPSQDSGRPPVMRVNGVPVG